MTDFRASLKPLGRRIVKPGARVFWRGGLVLHRGHLFLWQCEHRHLSKFEAVECAESVLHCDDDSLMAEELQALCDKR